MLDTVVKFLPMLGIVAATFSQAPQLSAASPVSGTDELSQSVIYYSEPEEPARSKKRKKPTSSIVQQAANDLQEVLGKMTKVEVPLKQVGSASEIPADQPAFVLGSLAIELGAKPPKTEFGEDGYVMEMKGKHLLLAGEGDAGTAHAVAEFLHQQGARFYMPGPNGEVIPERRELVMPAERKEATPDFGERRLWLNGGSHNKFAELAPDVPQEFVRWVQRNRLTHDSRISMSHMWNGVFRSAGITREEALAQHPAWFAEVKGKKNLRQLNLMNEEVVDLFVAYYRKLLEKQLKGKAPETPIVLSLSPDDQVILNDSAEAAALLDTKDIIFTHLPDATDYLIQFNNRVVEKLNREYPGVRLAFYVYSNYQNAPAKVTMNKNLFPFLAPLNFSRYHALTDRSKPNRSLLANIVQRWHATGATLGWRDYSFLCPDAMLPFNRLHMTRRDIPWLYENGVRYLSLETVSNWPNLLPEAYLLSRLLWDVNVDQEAELKEFYANFFGPAAAPMEAFVDAVSGAYDRLPFSSGNKEFVASVFTPEFLKSLREHIATAKKDAGGDEKILHRIGLMETPLRQAERFMAMRAAVNRFDYAEAEKFNTEILQAFDDDIQFNPVFLPLDNISLTANNTLTVRVNNEAPTELGVGGLIRPVALIAK